jgi:hypothetical protein
MITPVAVVKLLLTPQTHKRSTKNQGLRGQAEEEEVH